MTEPVGITIARLKNDIERMEQRLSDGWDLIEDHKRRGRDVDGLETFWIELLHAYEDLLDELSTYT